MPDKDKIGWKCAEAKGYNDFYSGKKVSDNPFEDGTIEHVAWFNGYIGADVYESKNKN